MIKYASVRQGFKPRWANVFWVVAGSHTSVKRVDANATELEIRHNREQF